MRNNSKSMPIVPPADPISKLNSNSNRFLSRQEVILRRLHHARELLRIYKNQYWGLMEEARAMYSKYVWETGKSPFETNKESTTKEENNTVERAKCKWKGCDKKAMPLTDYCFNHILEDKKQTLYKGCRFRTKRSPLLRCNKPVLRSKVPCYCAVHYQKTQKQISQGLKDFGLSFSEKTAPKFHFLVSEYVRQLQGRRREAKLSMTKSIVKMEINSVGMLPLAPNQKTDFGHKNIRPPIVSTKNIIPVSKLMLPPRAPTKCIIPSSWKSLPRVPTHNIIPVGMNKLSPLVPRGTDSSKQSAPLQKSRKGVMIHPTPIRNNQV